MHPKTFNNVEVADADSAEKPLLEPTCQLFEYVATKNFDALAALCDDDFGIVDLDPEGKNVMVRTRAEWESWFKNLFHQLDSLNARTHTRITKYDALPSPEMTMTVVEFTQFLELNGERHPFDCVATIVWKWTGEAWKEARWHVSLLQRHEPQPITE